MKTKSLILAVVSIFAISSLAFAESQFVSNGPAVGIHKITAKNNRQQVDAREFGISEYNKYAMHDPERLDDRELGIGKYREGA